MTGLTTDTLQRAAGAAAISLQELRWLIEAALQSSVLAAGCRATARVWLDPAPGYRIEQASGGSRRGPLDEVMDAAMVDAVLHEYVQARVASDRDNSRFLRQLCSRVPGGAPRAPIHSVHVYRGAGVIVMDSHADLSPLIGRGGRNVRALQALAGLRQLHVVRCPPDPTSLRPSSLRAQEARLRSVLRSFGLGGYQLVAPAQPRGRWTIRAAAGEGGRMRGAGGTKMLFIARIAAVPIRVVDGTAP
jgi:hypothetical protein